MIFILFSIGIISNILGTLAGGGGLISLPTMLLLGIPAHSAIGANKVANMISTFSNFFSMLRRKEVTFTEAWPILLCCGLGGMLGGATASQFSAKTLTLIAIILLIFAFVLSFLGKTSFGELTLFKIRKKTAALLGVIGFYDGVFGPGSGTLLIYLYGSEKIAYIKAVILGRIGVFATCTGAAIMYIATGHILWYETLFLTVGSVIGAQIGLKLARKISVKLAQLLLRFITVLLIVQLLIEFFTS